MMVLTLGMSWPLSVYAYMLPVMLAEKQLTFNFHNFRIAASANYAG